MAALSTRTSGPTGVPRLVLVHGFTQSARCWSPIDDALAADHEVVGVDAPGHGGSSAVSASFDEAVDLLAAAGGRGTYLGYSMGGRLALAAAIAHPEVVERLVLIGASPGLADPDERATRIAADEALADHVEAVGVDAFLDEWLALPLFAGLHPAAAHLDERRRNTAAGLADSLRRCGTGAQPPQWDRLGELGARPARAARRRRARRQVPRHRRGDGRWHRPDRRRGRRARRRPHRPPRAARRLPRRRPPLPVPLTTLPPTVAHHINVVSHRCGGVPPERRRRPAHQCREPPLRWPTA